MFNNTVVGVDGAEGGRDAIALARILCGQGGKLTFAYVYNGDRHVWRGSSPPFDASERERTHALLENARQEAGVEAELCSHGSTSVGRGLHEVAEKSGCDLVVIGSSRRGLLGRVLMGDDTRAALNGAPCAIAIAPAGFSEHPVLMREIGVGYDGSPESEHALTVARTLAEEQHTKLSAFEAVSLPSFALAGGAMTVAATIEDMIEAARAQVAQLDGVEPHAAYGLPAEELALYSASLDLLVVGSRSYGPVGRLVHGSTAHQLARIARCPLLVLTRAARKAAATSASEATSAAENSRETAAVGAAK